MNDLREIFVEIIERIARLEQRAANQMIHGPVEEVDAKKQQVRLRMGGEDAKPYLSPWIPYGQFAGALKVHTPPTKGQNMTAFSPTGDPAQAVALPLTWNNQFKSPSEKQDENVLTYGNVRMEVKNDRVHVKVGAIEFTLEGGVVTLKASQIKYEKA